MSRAPTHRWADWDLSAWCPVLSPVPQIESTIPSDPEAQAAKLIYRMRAEFFGQSMPVSCESPRGANNPPDLQGFEYFGGNPDSVLRARFIFAELSTITRDALWGAQRGVKDRQGTWHTIGMAHAMQTASGPQSATTRAELVGAITRATRRAMDFARTHAELHGEPPPFGGLPDPEPAEVVALAAIFDAADALRDQLQGVGDRERTLDKATLLAGYAIELRDAATLAAQAAKIETQAPAVAVGLKTANQRTRAGRIGARETQDRGERNARLIRRLLQEIDKSAHPSATKLADEIKRRAARLSPSTDASEAVSRMTNRRIRDLIKPKKP